MQTLTLFSPLFFTFAAFILTAVESSFFPNLGVPPAFTPDLNLALIIFLSSCPLGLRTLLGAIGITLATNLFSSFPGMLQPLLYLSIFLVGCLLNRTIFMNHLVPQAVLAGSGKLFMTLFLGLTAGAPIFSNLLLKALGGIITTTLFTFPILFFLNTLQECFVPTNSSGISG
ncbi:MAG: hypothetical protein JXR80_10815 [Deltaproteobacteria bacterium]|nr:hypothetical protein [Deltaproteobacteria bacterium]